MTRSRLLRELRARGVPAQPHHVDRALGEGRLVPEPVWLDGRRDYAPEHLEQLATLVRGIELRRASKTNPEPKEG